MTKLNEEETIKLVELYVENECLWNLTSIHYRNRNMRQAAEKEIIEKMEITGFGLAELKQKIKNLRCTYNQECGKIKKSLKSGTGTEDIYVPNIKWFNAFDEIMKRAKAGKKTDCSVETSIFQNTNSLDENEENEEQGTVDELHSPEGQSSKSVPKTPVSEKPPAPKRNKLDNLTKAVLQLREVTQVLQDTSSNNEHEAFGNFIAATLNSLPKPKALLAQHEIQGILLKYRLAETEPPKSLTCENVFSAAPPTSQYSGRDSYDNHSLHSAYSNYSRASASNSTLHGATDLVYSPEGTVAQSESIISQAFNMIKDSNN